MRSWNIPNIKREIIDSSAETAVYVGCDSKKMTIRREKWALYTTIVVLHVDSNKGCKVWYRNDRMRDYGNIKMRMLQETYFATGAALDVLPVVGDRPFEIHLDLNPNPRYASNAAVKEAIGYVMGMTQIKPKIKPDACIASIAADLIGKGKAAA